MNKNLALYFSLLALLVGSFLGSYYWRRSSAVIEDPVAEAKSLIDGAAGNQEKLAKASDLLKRELTGNSSDLLALFLQGRALQQRGLIDPAIESYKRYFQEKISIDFAANFNAAELYELKGDLQSAERYFIGSINTAPQEGAAWERLIRLLLKQNRNQDAKAYFDALAKQSPASDVVKRLAPVMPQ